VCSGVPPVMRRAYWEPTATRRVARGETVTQNAACHCRQGICASEPGVGVSLWVEDDPSSPVPRELTGKSPSSAQTSSGARAPRLSNWPLDFFNKPLSDGKCRRYGVPSRLAFPCRQATPLRDWGFVHPRTGTRGAKTLRRAVMGRKIESKRGREAEYRALSDVAVAGRQAGRARTV